MSVNVNNNPTNYDSESLINGLTKAAIPIAPMGALFRKSTRNLAKMIVQWLNDNCKIIEADHVIMYPCTDKSGNVYDFKMYAYFNTRNSSNSGVTPKITKVTNGKLTRNNEGRVNLADTIGQNTNTGGFNVTKEFKMMVASIADLNNDGNLVIQADKQYPFVAVVRLDFFKVIGVLLGISEDDNYNFAVMSCEPFRNNTDDLDYNILIAKFIDTGSNNRRGRNGVNYDNSDRRIFHNDSGSYINKNAR